MVGRRDGVRENRGGGGVAIRPRMLPEGCGERREVAITPSPGVPHYSFAFVGRRDSQGRFLHRDEFYTLSPDFYRAYRDRMADYLSGLAKELF